MLNETRRRLGSSALLAAGLIILVPALAEAQLFPNRTIRREKPSCATEPPFYKQVRRDYFGYYPTCWSRFPAGWGCPCPDPELQMLRDNLAKNPVDINSKPANASSPFTEKGDDKAMDDPEDPKKPGDEKLPLPPSTSPFEMDPKPAVPPAGTPPGRGTLPNNPGAGASLPPASPSTIMELPALPATSPTTSLERTTRPGSMTMYPDDATLTSNEAAERPDLGPLPNAPTPAPFTPENGSTFVSASTPMSNGAETSLGGAPIPAQAPKRRSLLAQLFNRNNTTTQKR